MDGQLALVSLFCNTPSCPLRASLKSKKEQDLIQLFEGKKLFKCGRCKARYYCSTECQHADWKSGHKTKCADIIASESVRKQLEQSTTAPMTRESKKVKEEEGKSLLPPPTTQEYISKPLPKGEVVSKTRKVTKMLQGIPESVRRTGQLVAALCGTQTIMSDKFDRIAKGLPARGKEFIYNTCIDFHGNTSEEIVNEWFPQVNKFKTWMWRASDAALDFDQHMTEILSKVPEIASGVEMMLEWKPNQEEDGEHDTEGLIVSTILAGCAHQKYYLERMLPATGPLHGYFTLLLSWVEWEGPVDNKWSAGMQLILSAILSGVELTEKSYHTVLDPALLIDLEPAYRKLVQVIGNDSRRLLPMKDIPSEATHGMIGVLNHVKLHFAGLAMRDLAACSRAKNFYPRLDLSPLNKLCQYHQRELENVLRRIGNKYRQDLSDEFRVLATIIKG